MLGPMTLVTLAGVSKSHAAQHLFSDVGLMISAGRRFAIVGPNGAGKTTLLELITGDQSPDSGTITRARDTVIGYLRQEVAESRGRSALAEVLAGAGEVSGIERRMRHIEAELNEAVDDDELTELMDEYGRIQHRFEALGGYGLESEARRILAGLGFADSDMERDIGTFSGGWMMRVALARLLLQNPDVLLLDEPSNHLDLASVEWLTGFLAQYAGAIVLVSHDRDFINEVANRVVELHDGSATEYVGDYADFVDQRAERIAQLESAAKTQQRKIAHTQAFIDRFRYKKTKARQVQSRIKSLEKLERVAQPQRRAKSVKFRFPEPPRSGRTVITLKDVAKRYGETVVYAGDLDLTLERGQRVALIGPNGAGKSTLLKMLAGVLEPDAGTLQLGSNVRVAYFAQHQIEALNPANTVFAELNDAAPMMATAEMRRLLGAFLFTGDCGRQEGRRAVRRRADPPRPRQAPRRSGQSPVPRRADEPPRHPVSRRPRGRPQRLRRHDGADHPRPIPDPERRQRDRRGGRRQGDAVPRRLRVLRRQARCRYRDPRRHRGGARHAARHGRRLAEATRFRPRRLGASPARSRGAERTGRTNA